jgi:hypothetical protein
VLHRNAVERNAERGSVGAVGDLLASRERRKHKLDRIGTSIGAAEIGPPEESSRVCFRTG